MRKPVRVAIYARLSRNRTGERSASTARQERDCRKLCEARGWEIVQVEVDDDVSAYSGKTRPGYERIMAAVEVGQIGAIVAWAPDRLHRSPVELESFIDTVERAGIEVATVQAGRVDLATPAGRMQARMLGNVARYESEHRSARTSAAHAQIAAEGRWKGGRRPYGYQPQPGGSMDVVPDEAVIVREIHERIMDGQRPGTIATDLNRRGVPTVTGAPWSLPTVRNMVQSPTLAGRRMWKGEDVGAAKWPPILTTAEVLAARAMLAAGPKRGRVPRVSLLSGGRVRCSRCEVGMRTLRRSTGVRVYRCVKCYRQIVADQLDEWAGVAVLELMSRVVLPDPSRPDPSARQAKALEAKIDKANAAWASDLLSDDQWRSTLADLQSRLSALRASGVPSSSIVANLTGPGAAQRWAAMGLDGRQAAFDAVLSHLDIDGDGPRGPGFREARIRPVPL